MGDLFREILNLFREEESFIRKVIKGIFALTAIVVLLVMLESAMGLITIGRLERKVNLIKELNSIAESGLGHQGQLTSLFDETVDELNRYTPELGVIVSNLFPNATMLEVLSSAAGLMLSIPVHFYLIHTDSLACRLKAFSLIMVIGVPISIAVRFLLGFSDPFLMFYLSSIIGVILPVIHWNYLYYQNSQKLNQLDNGATSHAQEA